MDGWSSGFSLRSCRVNCRFASVAIRRPTGLPLTTRVKLPRLKPELLHPLGSVATDSLYHTVMIQRVELGPQDVAFETERGDGPALLFARLAMRMHER